MDIPTLKLRNVLHIIVAGTKFQNEDILTEAMLKVREGALEGTESIYMTAHLLTYI